MIIKRVCVDGLMALNSSTNDENYLSEWNDFEKNAVNDLRKCIQSLNSLCHNAEEHSDYCALFPHFRDMMKIEEKRIKNLMARLLSHGMIRLDVFGKDSLTSIDDVMDRLIDSNDVILERINNSFDEELGLAKRPESPKQLSVGRPQETFVEEVDNGRESLFTPSLPVKYNSLIDDVTESPYNYELSHFQVPSRQLGRTEVMDCRELGEIRFVDTEDELEELVDCLSKQTEFGVDLEHHSYHSFNGFTCLVQISTRDCDYVIDALSLRHKLNILNKVFTDPDILKVFHGADCDIPWLQKDFSVYVVNMFDTGQAARALSYPRFSLAYLLHKFASVQANKTYQLADWRIRPLPRDMVDYASLDTHYLLHIYDNVRNELVDNDLLMTVYQKSTNICKKVYSKPQFSPRDCFRLPTRTMDCRQKYALLMLYDWRDRLARLEDESLGFVLPTHILLELCFRLPQNKDAILACCKSPLVYTHVDSLLGMLVKACVTPYNEVSQIMSTFSVDSSDPTHYHVGKCLNRLHDFDGSDLNWAKCEYIVGVKHVTSLFVKDGYNKSRRNCSEPYASRARVYQYYCKGVNNDVMATACLFQCFAKWEFKESNVKTEEKSIKVEDKEETVSVDFTRTESKTFFPFSRKREKPVQQSSVTAKRFRSKKTESGFTSFDYANKVKAGNLVKTGINDSRVDKVKSRVKSKTIFKKFKNRKKFVNK